MPPVEPVIRFLVLCISNHVKNFTKAYQKEVWGRSEMTVPRHWRSYTLDGAFCRVWRRFQKRSHRSGQSSWFPIYDKSTIMEVPEKRFFRTKIMMTWWGESGIQFKLILKVRRFTSCKVRLILKSSKIVNLPIIKLAGFFCLLRDYCVSLILKGHRSKRS